MTVVQLAIDVRTVQVWYQNRRQRAKRDAASVEASVRCELLHAATPSSVGTPGPPAVVGDPLPYVVHATPASADMIKGLQACVELDAQACVLNLLDTAKGAAALRTAAQNLLMNNPILRVKGGVSRVNP